MSFRKINTDDFFVNPITKFSDEWMLLTAGDANGGYNTMTISWGHMGAIWGNSGGMPSVAIYVRPQRYTKEFIDSNDMFTLSVLSPEYKEALAYLGSASGRDGNKVLKAGLTPVFDLGTTYFDEADMVLVCRKLYHFALQEDGFVDKSIIDINYPKKDFHEMYIGEIVSILVKE